MCVCKYGGINVALKSLNTDDTYETQINKTSRDALKLINVTYIQIRTYYTHFFYYGFLMQQGMSREKRRDLKELNLQKLKK